MNNFFCFGIDYPQAIVGTDCDGATEKMNISILVSRRGVGPRLDFDDVAVVGVINRGRTKGVRYEWRFLKLIKKKGLPLPIKEVLRTFIGKEARTCLRNLSATL